MQDLNEQWVAEYEAHDGKWAPIDKRYWKGQEMGLTVKESGGGSFRQAPVGTHPARCIKVLDIGTQKNEWQGETKLQHQLILVWELPTETLEIDGIAKPFTISEFYTASLHEKAKLRGVLENWRGKGFTQEELNGFDLKNVLTKPCLLTVIEKNGKSRVGSVSALPKGMECPPQFNMEVFFSLEDFNQVQFDELPEGIQKIVARSPEYARATGGTDVADPHFDDLEDSIPF